MEISSDPWLVGVVGAGQMGAGIAQVCAQAGHSVVLVDADPAALERARDRIQAGFAKAVEKRATALEVGALSALVAFHSDLAALARCDLVVEAVPESLELKRRVLEDVAAVVPGSAIIATNTSSLPIGTLAESVMGAERFLGLHFFNPVPVLPLVEVVPHAGTAPAVVARVRALATDSLGKQAVQSQDRAGFIVNALLIPYLCSAIRLLEAGVATAPDIDTAMVAGCAHPMGPLALADLVGLDTVLAIADTLARELGDESLAAPRLLWEKVDRGELGRKSGRGFYDY